MDTQYVIGRCGGLTLRKSLIYVACITAGVIAGIAWTSLICRSAFPPDPNPGDGILAMIFLMVFILAGVFGGVLLAKSIQKKRSTHVAN
jgi:uncharacterized protein YneF (UPF0154 family)